MNKLVKRLLTGTLAFATILTALPVTAVHASGNQYWTESAERVGYIEHVMNDGSIKSTFHEGHMKVEGETAYCVDINTSFKNGYKTRSDASSRMSSDQIADVALSLEYVKQYTASHTNLNYKQVVLCQEKVQIKCNQFSLFLTKSNLLFLLHSPRCFQDIVPHIHLETNIHNDCEYALYCKMFRCTQKSVYMHVHN